MATNGIPENNGDQYTSHKFKYRMCRSTMPAKYSKRSEQNAKLNIKQYHDKSSKELKELEDEATVYHKEGNTGRRR